MDRLSTFQNQVVQECLEKQNGCLALPMGAGKTLISLVLSQRLPGTGPTLVVVSKTLVQSWMQEIGKFFKNLDYVIFHKDLMEKRRFETYKPGPNTIVITTPDVTGLIFKNLKLEDYVLSNKSLSRPISAVFRKPGNFLYSTRWKCIIVDEVQKYTMQKTLRCRSLYNIYAKFRWLLSGTPINEPDTNRLLGYHWLLGDYTFPIAAKDITNYIKSNNFHGLDRTMVIRKKATATPLSSVCTVIEHKLSSTEQKIYELIRKTIELIIDQYGYNQIPYEGIGLLSLIYLRQFLVTPHLAFKALNTLARKSDRIYRRLKPDLTVINSSNWGVDKDFSSRIQSVVKTVASHPDDKIVMFTCFRTSLELIYSFIPEPRPVFVIESTHTAQERAKKIRDFCASTNGVLLLTYSIGAEGLNLQCAHVAMMVDVWWNDGVTQQAVARVLRQGQTQLVRLYFFTSNTGLEQGLFHKHEDKLQVLRELGIGKKSHVIKRMHIRDILVLINKNSNKDKLEKACPLKN